MALDVLVKLPFRDPSLILLHALIRCSLVTRHVFWLIDSRRLKSIFLFHFFHDLGQFVLAVKVRYHSSILFPDIFTNWGRSGGGARSLHSYGCMASGHRQPELTLLRLNVDSAPDES